MADGSEAFDLDFWTEELPLARPFRITGKVFVSTPVVCVTVTRGGLTGRGEAAGVYYLDDTPAKAAALLTAHAPRLRAGVTRHQLRAFLPPGAARNALDCALWELESLERGEPVWSLAGLAQPEPIQTTMTLGADAPEAMVEAARAYPGPTALKLKLTGEPVLDAERVRRVRAAFPDCWIGVDVNQGFTPAVLDRLLPDFLAAKVALIEQPFRRGDEHKLDGVDRPIPIAADESCLHLGELDALVGRFDAVNIKLDKCGGLTEALMIVDRARALGLRVMVGNMMGSSLATAPAFVLGQRCDIVDLDGPLFLAADREPAVTYSAGRIFCSETVWGAARATVAGAA